MAQELGSIGVGIVGTGFMGPVHVEALRRIGVRVVGIAGNTHADAKMAADALYLDKAYESYEAMLDDPQVHSVHLGVPNHLHFPMTKQAIAAGKHVMCEKPLAMNSQESAELVKLASETSRVCGVNYNLRYYPLCQDAAARVQRGELGELIYAAGGYCQDWLLYDTDFNWRVLKDQGGPLRAIADIGTHWLDLMQMITGQRIVAVCADLHTIHKERIRPPEGSVQTFSDGRRVAVEGEKVAIDTEDMGCLLIRFENGTRGNVTISQVSAGRKNRLYFELAGTESALAWDGESPNEMWIGHRNQPNGTLLKDPTLMSARASQVTAYPPGHAEGYPDTFKQCFKSFYEYIASGKRTEPAPFPTFADGHQELLLCEAILASHQQQKWIEVPRS